MSWIDLPDTDSSPSSDDDLVEEEMAFAYNTKSSNSDEDLDIL